MIEFTEDSRILEIGGPSGLMSDNFYTLKVPLDNAVFSLNNVWNGNSLCEYENIYENDATDLKDILSDRYSHVLCSHMLEHVANPLKALFEMKRVLKSNGYLVIVVPERSGCFDHDRDITPFATLLQKYQRNVGEDDLSSLREILTKHDLAMDLPAGDFVQFVRRSLDNHENRCLHHHVFDESLLRECMDFVGFEKGVYWHKDGNQWFVMRKPKFSQISLFPRG